MSSPFVLLTVEPLVDAPGCLPTEAIACRLAGRLLAAGHRVRVLAEHAAARGWPNEIEVVPGSITRPAEAPAAFEDLGALVLMGAEPATVHDALSRAREGGAAKVVTLSSHGPEVEVTLPPEDWHWLATEVVVERSGLTWTHVVPPLLFAMTLTGSYPFAIGSWRDLIRAGRPIRRAFPDARLPFLHEEDFAAVLERVLFSSQFDHSTLHVAGVPLSDVQRARTLSAVLGREVAFEALSEDEAARVYRESGMAEQEVEYVLTTTAWFADHPEDAGATAEQLLGRAPTPFEGWVREHAALFD